MKNSTNPGSRYALVALLCATAAIGLAAPTNAAEIAGPDVTLRYENLAIDSEQGAAQLLKRIEGAAGRVCAWLDHGDLASRRNAQDCRRQLTADAVRKVNHPMLLAVYGAEGRGTPPVARLTK